MRSVRPALAVLLLLPLLGALSCGALKRCAYAGPGRDDWQQPDAVIEALELRPGMRVADVGAGGGYFTFRLADAVGPEGRVLAVDVDPDMTSYLEERAAEGEYGNVEVVLATPEDPGLPEDGVDLVFLSNTYHHLPEREGYFRHVAGTLRPAGRVAIVEYDGRHEGFFSLFHSDEHTTSSETIREEMAAAGYVLDREHDFLERQAFLVFRRP